MIFRNIRKQSTLSFKVIVVCLLLSGSLVSPGYANGVPDAISEQQYDVSWEKIEGSLTAGDAVEERYIPGERRLVDNYELFDVPIGASISIYIKGNPNGDGLGLCDPLGIVYEVAEGPQSVVAYDNGSGRGGFTDLYDGVTCENVENEFRDTFFTVSTVGKVVSDFRIQVSSSGILDNPSGLDALNKFNSGAYTLYVSVGNFNGTVACTTGFFTIFENVVTGNTACTGTVIIPFGVTSIRDGAFEENTELTSVTIPDSVISIGEYAFYGNTKLTTVTIPNSVTSIGDDAFSSNSLLNTVTIGNSVTSIGNSAFRNNIALRRVDFGDSVESIGMYAFAITDLRSVTIPDSVTSIDQAAFEDTGLTSVTFLGNRLSIISQSVFAFNPNLRSITIPNSVTSIARWAFEQSGLESVTIGNSVTRIDMEAFIKNASLTSVTFLRTAAPPTLGTDIFFEVFEGATANVPYNATGFPADGLPWNGLIVRYASAPAGDSGSSSPKTDVTITPAVVKTAAGVFNLKNKTYLSKNDIKTKLSKNRSFKRNPEDLYKYSIFKASKKNCIMRGNYVMGLKKTGACELWVTRTTAKGAKYKYWVQINYIN